jgi:hypothetical protein
VPDPIGITDDMIEAAARALAVTPWEIAPNDLRNVIRAQAERVLSAALAGRTVIDVPEPDSRGYCYLDGNPGQPIQGYHRHGHGGMILAQLGRFGDLDVTTAQARQIAGHLLATADFADRRAAEWKSRDGESS